MSLMCLKCKCVYACMHAYACTCMCVRVIVQAWFHSLSLEMTSNNISVTVACPGPVVSNLTAVAFTGKLGEVWHVLVMNAH